MGASVIINRQKKNTINYKIIKKYCEYFTYFTHILLLLFIYYTVDSITVGFYIIYYGSWNLLYDIFYWALYYLSCCCCEETLFVESKKVCVKVQSSQNLEKKRITSKLHLSLIS